MSTLKRGHDDATGEEGFKKIKSDGTESRNTDGMMEIRVLIDNYEASVIIGKAGSNVKAIRAESGAFVSILKTESPISKERVMTVKGSEEGIAKAMECIVRLMVEAANQKKDPSGAVGETETQYGMKILIHKFLAGSIIGKGGSIIKEIQDQTKARLQLSNDALSGSTEKTVTITGTPETFYACALRVLGQLANNPLRSGSTTILYVPGNAGAFAATAAGPYGAGSYGAPAPSPYGGGYGGPPPGPYGAPQHQAPYPPPQQQSYGGPPVGGGGAASKTEKIVIPTVCAGTVIGKGGSIIQNIKTQSGTAITIADAEPTAPNDRVVAVTGSAQGIQTAIYLIRQRVESYQPPNAGGGAMY